MYIFKVCFLLLFFHESVKFLLGKLHEPINLIFWSFEVFNTEGINCYLRNTKIKTPL